MENKDGFTVQIQVPNNVAYDTQKGDSSYQRFLVPLI